jgi:hypothetical protein
VLNVWDPSDRTVVPIDAVEDFIVAHSLRRVKLKDEYRARSHEFDVRGGDGVYFPSTSPHMTRSDPEWAAAGDRVAISIGVNFYTPVTRRTAQIHQINRVLRKCGLSPLGPGESPAMDALKAPIGKVTGIARSSLARVLRPILHGPLQGASGVLLSGSRAPHRRSMSRAVTGGASLPHEPRM